MKHEGSHKLDFACLGCVRKHIDHKNKLISLVNDFVRVLDNGLEIQPNSVLHHCAKEILILLEKEKDEI